ncbi:MAG: hypothetical protein WC812_04715 [Candidatus Pacearchaeota archaeon]|jgi:hypothetical protein
MGDGEEDWCPILIDLEKLVIGQVLPVEERYAEYHKNEIVQYFDESTIGTSNNYKHFPTLNTYALAGNQPDLFYISRSDFLSNILPKWAYDLFFDEKKIIKKTLKN